MTMASQRLGQRQDIIENHLVIHNEIRTIKMQTEQDGTDQGLSLSLSSLPELNRTMTSLAHNNNVKFCPYIDEIV